jgi:two-component sensor histidine kinase
MAPPAEDWRTVVFDEDVAAIEARLAEASDRRGTLVLEHRMRGGDGSEVWLASRAVPIMDEEGRIVEWFGCSTDVTARHRAEEHQRLLMQELEHRVRNTLAVVQSIAEQTFRDGIDMADARRRFSSRLAALAKANSLLTGERWASASLAGTIEQALKVHQADTARLELAGPDIAIPARTALTLTLALHELATNASKYGAWANDAGMVKLGWSIDPALDGAKAPVLRLDWRERGGPEVAAPRRRGFGSRLVERGLASELEGTVELRFDPAGVTCRVEAPLRSVQRQA